MISRKTVDGFIIKLALSAAISIILIRLFMPDIVG